MSTFSHRQLAFSSGGLPRGQLTNGTDAAMNWSSLIAVRSLSYALHAPTKATPDILLDASKTRPTPLWGALPPLVVQRGTLNGTAVLTDRSPLMASARPFGSRSPLLAAARRAMLSLGRLAAGCDASAQR